MAVVKLYNKDGDDKAKNIQENIEKQFGFLPQVFQAMGNNGAFLDAALKVTEAAGKGLDPKTKELICIAVSAANGCEYCVSAHRAMARKAGVEDSEITGAIEVASAMSLFNSFNKAIGIDIDIKA